MSARGGGPTTVLVAVAAVLAAAAASCTGAAEGATGVPARSSESAATALDPATYAEELMAAIDVERAGRGLTALERSDCAAAQAAARADALVGAELAHAPLGPVIEACDASGAAENLVRTARPAADALEAWLGSAGHADNLLTVDFASHAIACTPDGSELVCAEIFLQGGLR